MAYEYVHASEYHRFKVDCADILKTTCARLKKEGISAVPTLIGSGGRNMVTRNGEGPYDLDYNLEIMKALPEHLNNLRGLKETVRVALNRSEGFECFDDAQDSTSCLTAILHFEDSPEVEFSFDVGIVRKNRFGDYTRH